MRTLLPTAGNIAEAGEALQAGKLVIIPTETVYGLAANALDADAVRKIFDAKGRPSDNPLIVHIAARHDVDSLVSQVPAYAEQLMDKLWPGPLTLVLPKLPHIPDVTTASLDTVAIRMPAHGIALRVIQAAKVPLAAPSANRFMSLSPTRPDHIDPLLAEHVEILMDGGPCDVGLESTVVDCTGPKPRVLRPGRISRADLENILGEALSDSNEPEVKRSPGMYRRHYAPRTQTVLSESLRSDEAGLVLNQVPQNPNQISMPADPTAYATALYDSLHVLDARDLEKIVIQTPPNSPEWEAIWDRIRKATQY